MKLKKKKINVDLDELSLQLGIPVVGTSARSGKGLDKLKEKISEMTNTNKKVYFQKIAYDRTIHEAANILTSGFDKIIEVEKLKKLNTFWLATRFLDLDDAFLKSATEYIGFNIMDNDDFKNMLSRAHSVLEEGQISKKICKIKLFQLL